MASYTMVSSAWPTRGPHPPVRLDPARRTTGRGRRARSLVLGEGAPGLWRQPRRPVVMFVYPTLWTEVTGGAIVTWSAASGTALRTDTGGRFRCCPASGGAARAVAQRRVRVGVDRLFSAVWGEPGGMRLVAMKPWARARRRDRQDRSRPRCSPPVRCGCASLARCSARSDPWPRRCSMVLAALLAAGAPGARKPAAGRPCRRGWRPALSLVRALYPSGMVMIELPSPATWCASVGHARRSDGHHRGRRRRRTATRGDLAVRLHGVDPVPRGPHPRGPARSQGGRR